MNMTFNIQAANMGSTSLGNKYFTDSRYTTHVVGRIDGRDLGLGPMVLSWVEYSIISLVMVLELKIRNGLVGTFNI